MTTDLALPADRFALRVLVRFDFEGVEFVCYADDGHYVEVVASVDFDAETSETDYTEWCYVADAAPEAVYVEAARVWGRNFTSGAHGHIDCPLD